MDQLKCKVDVAYYNSRKIAALATVIRDRFGRLIAGKVQKIPCFSSRLAEALTLREGLILANSRCFETIMVESDCLEVVDACRNCVACSELMMVAEDVHRMRNWFSHYALLWTPRESNCVAHQVAHLHLNGNLKADWVVRPPSIVANLLRKDSLKL